MPEPHTAAIALGSNLPSRFGTPADNLQEAVARLRTLGRIASVSCFHATAPEIFTAQPEFVNAALLLKTSREPLDLMQALLAIEQAMGRVRTGVPHKGPRLIDLDLIFFGDRTMNTPTLILPHPGIAQRRFVLAPLAEIAPEWKHPATGLTVAEMLRNLQGTSAGSAA
jgi:2-amino-4-hydroxy-6-hydroxymethyldihydropteridine diphosphokinase